MSVFKMTERNVVFADWFKTANKNTRRRFMDQLRHSIKQSGRSVALAHGVSQITHVATVRIERLSDEHIKRLDSCETFDEVLQCDLNTEEIVQNKLVIDENSCSSETTVILENDKNRKDLESLEGAIIISDTESDIDCVEDAEFYKKIAAPHPHTKKRRRSSNGSLTSAKSSSKDKQINRLQNRILSNTTEKSIKDKCSENFEKVTGINNNRLNKNSDRLFKRFSRINEKYNDLFGSDSPTSSPDLLECRPSPELPLSDNETFEVTKKTKLIPTDNDEAQKSHIHNGRIPCPYSQTLVATSIDEENVFKICDVIPTPHFDNVQTDKLESFNQTKKRKKSIRENKLPEVPISDYKITSSEYPFIKTLKRKRGDICTDKHYGTSQNKLKRRHSAFVNGNAKQQMKTPTSLDIASRRISHSVLDSAAWKITNSIADINHNDVLSQKTAHKIARKLHPLSENQTPDIDSNSPSPNSLVCSVNIESLDMDLLLKNWNYKSRVNKENVTIEKEKSNVTSTNDEMGLVIEETLEIANATEDLSNSKIVPVLKIQTDKRVVEPSTETEGNNFEVGNKEQSIDTLGTKKMVSNETLNVKNHYEDQPTIAVCLNKSKEDDSIIRSNISAREEISILQIESDEKENVDKNVEKNQILCDSVIQRGKAVNETTTTLNKDIAYRPIKHTDRRYVKKHPGKMESMIKRKLSLNKHPISNPTLTAKDKKACDMPCINDSEITRITDRLEPVSDIPILPLENTAENCEKHSSTSVSDNQNKDETIQTKDCALSSAVIEDSQNIHYILPHGVVISLDPKMLPATVSSIVTSQTDASEMQPSATNSNNSATSEVTNFSNITFNTSTNMLTNPKMQPQTVCDSGAPEVTELCNSTFSENLSLILPSDTDSVKITQPSTVLLPDNSDALNPTQAFNHTIPVNVTPIVTTEPEISKIQKNITSPCSNTSDPKTTQKLKENEYFLDRGDNQISSDIIFFDDETHENAIQSRLSSQVPTGENGNVPAKTTSMGSIKVHDESYLCGKGPIFSRMKDIDSLAQKIVVIMRDTQFYKVKFVQAEKLFAALQEREKKICHEQYKVAIAPLEQECVQQLLDAEMLVLSRDPQFWRVLSEVAEAFIKKTAFFPTFPTSLFRKVIVHLCEIRDNILKIIELNNIQQNRATAQVASYTTAVTANTQPIANIQHSTNSAYIYDSHSAMPHSNSIEPCNNREVNVLHGTSENSFTIQALQSALPAYSDRRETVNPLPSNYAHNFQNKSNIYTQQGYFNPLPAQVSHNTLPMHKHFINLHQNQYQQNPALEQFANQESNFTTARLQRCLLNVQQESFSPTATCPDKTQAPSIKKREYKKKKNVQSKKVTPPVNATMPPNMIPTPVSSSMYNFEAQNHAAQGGLNVSKKLLAYRKNQCNVNAMPTGNQNDAILAKHPNMVGEQNTRQASISNTFNAQNDGQYLTCSGQNRGSVCMERRNVFEQNAKIDGNQQKTIAQSSEENRQDYQNIVTFSRYQGQNFNQIFAISGRLPGSNETMRRQEDVSPCTTGATNKGQIRYTMQPQLIEHDTLIQQRVFSQNTSSSVVEQIAFSPNNAKAKPVFSPNNTSGVPQEVGSNSRSIRKHQTAPSPNNHTVGVQQGLFSPNNNTSGVPQEVSSNSRSIRTQQTAPSPNNHTVGVQQGLFSPNNNTSGVPQEVGSIRKHRTAPSPNNHTVGAQQGLFSPNNNTSGVPQEVSSNSRSIRIQQTTPSPNNHTVGAQQGLFSPNNNTSGVPQEVSSNSRSIRIQQTTPSPNNHTVGAQQGLFSPNNNTSGVPQEVRSNSRSIRTQQTAPSPNNHTIGVPQGLFSPNNNTSGVPQEVSSNSRSIRIQQAAPSPNNHTVGVQQGLFSPNNRNSATQLGFLVPNHREGVQQAEFSPTNHQVQHGVGVQREGFTLNNQHGNMQQGIINPNNTIVRAQLGGFSPNNTYSNIQHGNDNIMPGVQQRALGQNNHINMQQGFIRPSYHTNAQYGGFSQYNGLARMEQSVFNINNGLVQCNGNTGHYNAIPPSQSPNGLNTKPSFQANLINDEFAAQLLSYHNAQINGSVQILGTDVLSIPSMQQDGMFSKATPGRIGPGLQNHGQMPNQNVSELSQITFQDGVVQLNQKNSEVAAKIISNSVERSSRDSGFISPPNRDNFQSPELSSLTSP